MSRELQKKKPARQLSQLSGTLRVEVRASQITAASECNAGRTATDDYFFQGATMRKYLPFILFAASPFACSHEASRRASRASPPPSSTPPWARFAASCSKEGAQTVANFIGLADGTKDWKDPAHAKQARGAALQRHYLPPCDPRLHDPGRRPAGHRHRRSRLPVCDEFVPSLTFDRPGRLAMANPGPTPTARSSSSPMCRRRT